MNKSVVEKNRPLARPAIFDDTITFDGLVKHSPQRHRKH